MKVKVYVMYYDYGGDEGCSSPEKVTTDEAEADAWVKADPYFRTISEFEIEVNGQQCTD